MTDLTPEQRARALELYRLYFEQRYDSTSYVSSPKGISDLTVRGAAECDG